MLIGEKVCLGPLMHSDSPLLFRWLNDLEVSKKNGPFRPTDQTKFDQWFSGAGGDSARVIFAIRQRGDLRLMGYLQIINISSVSRGAEMGLLIGDPADRGLGYGQEAVTMAVSYGWRELNLHRISMFVIGDNPRAVHTYAKAGFQPEGVMRQGAYMDGRFQNITVMGILRDETAV